MQSHVFKSILIRPFVATAITFLVGFSSLDLHADPNTAQINHIIFAPGLYNKGSRTFGCILAKLQTSSSILAPNNPVKSIDSI